MAIDVLPARDLTGDKYYTLEYSTAPLTNGAGRLRRYDASPGAPALIADDLVTPTSMARSARTGDLFVTEISTGRIICVRVP